MSCHGPWSRRAPKFFTESLSRLEISFVKNSKNPYGQKNFSSKIDFRRKFFRLSEFFTKSIFDRKTIKRADFKHLLGNQNEMDAAQSVLTFAICVRKSANCNPTANCVTILRSFVLQAGRKSAPNPWSFGCVDCGERIVDKGLAAVLFVAPFLARATIRRRSNTSKSR